MARPRLVLPGYPYHVTQRGNQRQQAFFEDSDYALCRDLLAEAAERAGSEIWCYCLMPNHVHIGVVASDEDGLPPALWPPLDSTPPPTHSAPMQNLPDKTAFITGGASGIGLGIAKALKRAGMNVAIADIRQDHLDAAVAELGEERVLALRLDVTDRAAYAAAADAAEARFGKVHCLVNNAGVAVVGPVELASYGDWDWTMGVNLGGAVNGVVTMLPRILAHGEGGHIVSTASMSGLMPHPGAVIYTTGKAAVIGMMESMRGELEPRGVICSAFCPGAVQSNIAEAGKTRPAHLADTGYAESDRGRQGNDKFLRLFMTKEEVGERVREGIEGDELYICTHHEFDEGVRDRAAAMVAAIPERAENAEYKATFAMLFRNPVHAAEAARQDARNGRG